MKTNQKGFSAVELLIVIVVLGLIGTIGWLVYDRQNNKTDNQSTAVNQEDEPAPKSVDYKTLEDIKYTVPDGWKNAEGPFKDANLGSGSYLLSPDYQEAGLGQLFIESGAYIQFQKLDMFGINSETSPEEAVKSVKNSEDSYLDPESVKLTSVGNQQVVMFNSGHTADGVSVFYKTSGDQWLDIGFSTVSGNDGIYNAQESPHYAVFLSWLEGFIELNQ